jgi:Tfp pilus assembly protein PilF
MSLAWLGGCGSFGSQSLSGSEADGSGYPPAVENRYARALGYMDAGDDVRAVKELETFGAAYPDYAGPLVNLGIIHRRNGRPDAATLAFERATRLCTGCAVAHNELGIQQRQQGRFDDAEQSYLRAIEADPDYPLAYLNLGVLNDLYKGRPEVALQYYESYAARETDARAREEVDKWIADLKRRVGKTQGADQMESS